MNYRPEIDGLRAIAIVPVVLFHAGIPGFGGGYIGVDVFFVISGYLITSIILSDLAADQFSIKRFYERRARRILPALFTVMFACIPFAWMLLAPDDLRSFSNSLVATSLFSSNFLFWHESGYFDTETELKPLLHTWSLAVEEQYYLFFPLILMLAWKTNKHTIHFLLAAIFVSSLILAEMLSKSAESANFYLLPTRAWELMAGAMVAHTEFRKGITANNKVGSLMSFVGLCLVLLCSVYFSEGTRHPSAYTLAPVLGTLLIIKYGHSGSLVQALLSNKLLVGIGLISYSLYLWHQPVIAFAKIYQPFGLGYSARIGLIILSVLLACISWKYVENPFRRSNRFSQRRIFQLSSAVIPAACIMGFIVIFADKHIERFDQTTNRYLQQMGMSNPIKLKVRNRCNYSRTNDFEEFIESWDCLPSQINGVIIVGDSHAADKSWALRSAGFDIGQMTGDSCPLAKFTSTKSNKQCKRLFDKVINLAKDKKVGRIAISFEEDYSAKSIKNIINYWSKADVPLMIFGTMPEFRYLKRQVIAQQFLPENKKGKWQYRLGPNTDLTKNELITGSVTSLNTAELFCANSSVDNCKPINDGNVLLIDSEHLSEYGARHLGKQFKNSQTWNDWLASNLD